MSGPSVVKRVPASAAPDTSRARRGRGRLALEQAPQGTTLVEAGERLEQPAGDRIAGEAGPPRRAAVIAATWRSTAWSLIRLAGLVRQVSSDSLGVGKAPAGIVGGRTATQAAASGAETTRRGSSAFGSSEVVR